MNYQERIDFFSDQIAIFEDGYSFAKSNGNYHLLSFNSRQIFKNNFMQALITWRFGGDPRLLLTHAIDRATESIAAIVTLNNNIPIERSFHVESLKIIAFLMDKDISISSKVECVEEPDRRLDIMLGLSINNEISSIYKEQIEIELAKLYKSKKYLLAAQTYNLYFDILNGSDETFKIQDIIVIADKLYSKRASNSFFSGGNATEGGGPDNDIVVDYRLAAILKKINYQGSSIHCWNW